MVVNTAWDEFYRVVFDEWYYNEASLFENTFCVWFIEVCEREFCTGWGLFAVYFVKVNLDDCVNVGDWEMFVGIDLVWDWYWGWFVGELGRVVSHAFDWDINPPIKEPIKQQRRIRKFKLRYQQRNQP